MDTYQETQQHIYSISELNLETKEILETNFTYVWVEGEISNLVRPNSGHLYFSLKDEFAQIRCAMFQQRNHSLNFSPENGTHVLAKARVSLYVPRGDFQLIIDELEPAGIGALQRKFEQLKKKLEKEGLFAKKYKQEIPLWSKTIGVITSPTGAAIRDILSVLKRRFPSLNVIIYPTQVQGSEAAKQIVDAIKLANKHEKCDLLLASRGGGSIEDLWPFNEEIVARAIFASKIAIVTGIGHEIDFTIADFVADERAATPSAAAELISPDQEELFAELAGFFNYFSQLMQKHLHQTKTNLHHLEKRLKHPGRLLQEQMQRLDEFELRLQLALKNLLKHKNQQLKNLSNLLHTLSPLNTLTRGYAIVTRTIDNKILHNAKNINTGETINARLEHGQIKCTVIKK